MSKNISASHDLHLRFYYSPKNMIGQSQSGTGKTAAFVLTMLTRLVPGLNVPQVKKKGGEVLAMDCMLMVVL